MQETWWVVRSFAPQTDSEAQKSDVGCPSPSREDDWIGAKHICILSYLQGWDRRIPRLMPVWAIYHWEPISDADLGWDVTVAAHLPSKPMLPSPSPGPPSTRKRWSSFLVKHLHEFSFFNFWRIQFSHLLQKYVLVCILNTFSEALGVRLQISVNIALAVESRVPQNQLH